MNTKQKIAFLISGLLATSFVGLVLNIYLEFENNTPFTVNTFNNILLKSLTISVIVLAIVILMNRKKYYED